MTPDVNIIVAASRSDHPHHAKAVGWLSEALDACRTGGSVEILPMVAAGFLRLVTHPKVFPFPTPIQHAVAFLRTILDVQGVEMPAVGREWKVFERLCIEGRLTGNLVPDAWIAAVIRSGGYHLVTFDRGFSQRLLPGEYTLLEP